MEMKKPTNGPLKPGTIDALLGEPELLSLVELQKFIADELGTPGDMPDFSRSFRPLTDGLGLESPDPAKRPKISKQESLAAEKRESRLDDLFSMDPIEANAKRGKDALVQAFQQLPDSPPLISFKTTKIPPLPKTQSEIEDEISPTEAVAANRLLGSMRPAEPPVVSHNPEVIRDLSPHMLTPPPELPQPTFSRRFLAGLLDHIFVWTLFAGLIIITGVVLEGLSPSGLSRWFFSSFSNPKFIRIIALEFSVIWLTYLVMGIGVLDMTFGMWVWGLRLTYPNAKEGEWLTVRKCLRLVISFLFYPIPVLTPLLFLRSKGRNLVDMLSGTAVYRFAN